MKQILNRDFNSYLTYGTTGGFTGTSTPAPSAAPSTPPGCIGIKSIDYDDSTGIWKIITSDDKEFETGDLRKAGNVFTEVPTVVNDNTSDKADELATKGWVLNKLQNLQ